VVLAFELPRNGAQKLAYGETIAPPKVDTLRDENCPICGEDNAYDGHRCSICGYVAPPSPFKDPDLGMASRIDLRHQQDQFDQSMMTDPDRMAEQEQGGTLICNNCGTEFPQEPPETVDTDEAAPDVSAEETELGEGAAEGDICPACEQGTLVAQDVVADEEAQDGEIDPDEEDPDAQGEGNPFGGADPDEDEDQDGVPDDEEDEDEEEPPGVAVKSSDGPEDDDDEDDDQPVRKPKPKPKQ
jgi:hypothetical protein